MEWYDFVLILGTALAAFLFLLFSAFLKKKGKAHFGDCSGNCSSCKEECLNGKSLVEEYHQAKQEAK